MRALVIALLLLFAGTLAVRAAGPSFDCSRVTSTVNKMICADPALAALDVKLSSDFKNTRAQGRIDAKALDAEEAGWLHDVRNKCTDSACIAQAYQDRDAALLDASARAASPAAYDETRPFPADPALLAAAQSAVGSSCAKTRDVPANLGFTSRPEYQAVLLGPDFVVVPRSKGGVWLAFLFDTRGGDCKIADVAVLPGPKLANALLACSVPADDGSATPQSIGIGLRLAGEKRLVGYWDVDEGAGKLVREPLSVLAWDDKIICNYPESGD